jgi:dTDP-4-amino-4,6-dideoxygalactose transaminase
MIPFVDLKSQYRNIKTEIDAAVQQVITETAFIGGKYADKFEEEFAAYIGSKYCIACANGTDSLEILLKAFGIGPDDEVIVPSHTWISTAEAVSNIGATPVFVDTDQRYYTIDVNKIESKITKKTKAIIPVHLCGLPADMDTIMKIASKYKLTVIEDCAQAHGATYKGKKLGTIGHAASFSFYPGKNLGAYGDAGAMLTNDVGIAEKTRIISNHGQSGKHNHMVAGRNSRMDGINAAVLSVKLKYLDAWNKERNVKAALYNELLNGSGIVKPVAPSYGTHVYHLYVIQVNNRDEIQKALKAEQVDSAIHYPNILPATQAYHESDHRTIYPVSYQYSGKIISLPIYAELSEEQVKSVSEIVNRF